MPPSVDPLSRDVQPMSRRTLVLALAMALLATGAGVAVWRLGSTSEEKPLANVTLEDPVKKREETRLKLQDQSLNYMRKVAQALLDYRDRVGGGLRWPDQLEELRVYGMLPQDFNFVGPLGGDVIIYQPDMPLEQRPEGWVMAADIQLEERWGVRDRGPRIAAVTVIFGDGRTRTLDPAEFNQFAGMTRALEALDPARRGAK